MTSVRALAEANLPVPEGALVANAQVGTAAVIASTLIGGASGMAPLAVVTALVAVKKAVVVVLGIAPVGVPQAVLALGPVGVPVSVEVPPVPSLPAVNGALMGRGAEEPARDVSAFPVLRAVRRAAVMPRADRSVVVPAPKAARF